MSFASSDCTHNTVPAMAALVVVFGLIFLIYYNGNHIYDTLFVMVVVFGLTFLIYHNDHYIYSTVPEVATLVVVFGLMFLI